ncbi:short-chain dehydrogenase/reductase SDR [Pseudovibrio sp. FO-BEG1]|uniref:SDR family NAD(P)-dependent oxidoreductase n=1 Tax=Pseudovibrio sp. (strain FO-BEG1) TaxID=911045 RepID=UPI000238CE8C|nr:SDR family NAD(P)-dependent oxidoreductase [Pseudovibrio sp. FO-BEG1]AEV36925.1 short-chain dehydrogenase/reductase SDR [Pseudovibrio sp. FO-BEG1]
MFKEALELGGLAVVTGAASGVGKVAALRFAQRGLGVMLADLPGARLDAAVDEVRSLASEGATVIGVPTDVSNESQVNALADKAFETGEIAVLMNNAGIEIPSSSWGEMENWKKLLSVNLFGVIYGVHAFLPRMLEANRPAVVINTGSKQGITTPPGNPAYNTTKAGVKVISEQLSHELREANAPISVHLFVPGFTHTGINIAQYPEKPADAWTSEQTVDYFLERMAEGDFYVLCPDNAVDSKTDHLRVSWAAGDIIGNRPALSRWHPDYAEQFISYQKAGKIS